MPWLIRTRARRRGVLAIEYRNSETASHSRPTWRGSFRPIRSAIRPKNTFAGAWTNENRPTMTPVCTRSAQTDCAYKAMIGTSAFESIVPNIVAARNFAVIRRDIGRGTLASDKRLRQGASVDTVDCNVFP